MDRINQVCKNYFEIKMLHAWIRKYNENGGDRPDSMQEAHRLIKSDGDMDTHLSHGLGRRAHGKKNDEKGTETLFKEHEGLNFILDFFLNIHDTRYRRILYDRANIFHVTQYTEETHEEL